MFFLRLAYTCCFLDESLLDCEYLMKDERNGVVVFEIWEKIF